MSGGRLPPAGKAPPVAPEPVDVAVTLMPQNVTLQVALQTLIAQLLTWQLAHPVPQLAMLPQVTAVPQFGGAVIVTAHPWAQ